MSLHKKNQRIKSVTDRVQIDLNKAQKMRLFFGLSIFILLIFSQIFKGHYLELIALFALTPFFIFYFRRSRRLKSFSDSLQSLASFYNMQEHFQDGLFNKDLAAEQMYDTHLARDLDLGLLFANINFCFSKQGETLLNQWLCQNFKTSTLPERKHHLQELIKCPGLIRRLQMNSSEEKTDFARIETEISRSFFPEPIAWKWILPISWLLLLCCLFVSVPAILWKGTLLIYVGSMLSYMGKTKHLFSRLQDLHTDFSQLKEKIKTLERLASNLSFCPALKKGQASKDVKKISRLISLMSIKTNPILFYILNLILPWDFLLAELCERSRLHFYKHFKSWSLEVIEIEALACLANLHFYHDTHWAQESSEPFLSAKGVAHPLLNQKTLITNDFHPKDCRIFIITGSNMSGKSTFLRALGINYCLANIGAPVFAQEFSFKPMPIISCIRVSDSLRDGQSYFYAEVQRMKHILHKAKEQEIFFLIDEPLRGTNNRERLIGNKSYLQQILALKAQGFISTHDLELTQLADDDPKIANYHFSEQWVDQDLKFDYKIKEGPSVSTNALKILELEGLYQPPAEKI